MLCTAAHERGTEEERSLYLSCYGLFFFGVPHRGFNTETLRDLLPGEEGRRMMHDLDLGSSLLRMFQDAFRYDFRHLDSRIISAYETMGTKTFVEVSLSEDSCLPFLLPTDSTKLIDGGWTLGTDRSPSFDGTPILGNRCSPDREPLRPHPARC